MKGEEIESNGEYKTLDAPLKIIPLHLRGYP